MALEPAADSAQQREQTLVPRSVAVLRAQLPWAILTELNRMSQQMLLCPGRSSCSLIALRIPMVNDYAAVEKDAGCEYTTHSCAKRRYSKAGEVVACDAAR